MAEANISELSRRPLMALMGVVAIIAAAGLSGIHVVVGQSPPSSGSGCTNAFLSLAPCLNYVTGSNTAAKPPQGCCTAFATIVQNNATCLCQLLTNNNTLGIPVNQTQALALPGACHVKIPPISRCKLAVGGPANSPVGSPGTGGLITPSTDSPLSPGPSVNQTSGDVAAVFTPPIITSLSAGVLIAASFVW
eukprot:Gb_02441 [translate_table: standard]